MCRKCVFDVVEKHGKKMSLGGHEESLGRLFICQHVPAKVCVDRDGGKEGRRGEGEIAGNGGNGRATRGSEGGWW